MNHKIIQLVSGLVAVTTAAVSAEEADLAKKLSNPVADLISVPIQGNVDFGVGPGDGTKWTTNIQPVIPITVNDCWNVISRTILPVVDQNGLDATGDASDAFGLGDTTQSFFFSPKTSDPIWGLGPIFLIPTATDDVLGSEQWGMGPTGVVLKQVDHWTFGALANHLWKVGGDDGRDPVNSTFLQPFCAYTLPSATTFTVNSEMTYDWTHEQWTIPINFIVSQVVKFGDQPVQFFGGIRYYAGKPENGPDWGLRFGLTFLFPKS